MEEKWDIAYSKKFGGTWYSIAGFKKHIDLSKPIDLNLKYSRWHIVVEKSNLGI